MGCRGTDASSEKCGSQGFQDKDEGSLLSGTHMQEVAPSWGVMDATDSSDRPTRRLEDEAEEGAMGQARGHPVFTGWLHLSPFCTEKLWGPVSVPDRQTGGSQLECGAFWSRRDQPRAWQSSSVRGGLMSPRQGHSWEVPAMEAGWRWKLGPIGPTF